MDAVFGDKMVISVRWLYQMRLQMIVGQEFKIVKGGQYLFTSRINRKGAKIILNYPLNAYLTLTFDQSKRKFRSMENGHYHFSVQMMPNPYRTKNDTQNLQIEKNKVSNVQQKKIIIKNQVTVVGV